MGLKFNFCERDVVFSSEYRDTSAAAAEQVTLQVDVIRDSSSGHIGTTRCCAWAIHDPYARCSWWLNVIQPRKVKRGKACGRMLRSENAETHPLALFHATINKN